ncbi:aromatic amino acid aminotransferase [Ventosimonas gracilis]|uniref:Aminotransferase n=1 Tax=Ventosimonas gracilis TaxID=1680762 RepID=A0A139SVG8_9GAMM|nr:amino acid aminotransferase [Ventosimonas gracilis]KXU38606.1 aromatic amino acid aminotransferase [Ventosimonas gracilis]
MTLFSAVTLAPRDPILGLNEAFNSDPRRGKINLGVGVYFDEGGRIPLLQATCKAQQSLLATPAAPGYLPIDGLPAYNQCVQHLLFGEKSELLQAQRVVTCQALGGTGALKIGADFLKTLLPDAVVAISDPSWENHRALFGGAGFKVQGYRYYDAQSQGVDLAGMLEDLRALPPRSIVLLHACCHNPTGVDLDADDWQVLISLIKERDLVPFLDMAYQGFAQGIYEDAEVVRLLAGSGLTFLLASSFSKSFSLYGERIGALSLVCASSGEAERVRSQIKRVIRGNYSNPPIHGAALVSTVLGSAELSALWQQELTQMRGRICAMRQMLAARLGEQVSGRDFSFITRQRGMFSYSGLSAQQVDRLRDEFAIYAVGSGRICMAALNHSNLEQVVSAIAKVL